MAPVVDIDMTEDEDVVPRGCTRSSILVQTPFVDAKSRVLPGEKGPIFISELWPSASDRVATSRSVVAQ